MGEIRMTVPRLRFIGGSWYWRPSKSLRARGFKSVPLGKDQLKAIERARSLNTRIQRERTPGPRNEPGSVADIIRLYTQDERFTSRAQSTRKAYVIVLREIEREMGPEPIASIERPHLRALYRQIQKRGPGIARLHMAVWFNLMVMSMDEGWRTTNPASGLRIGRSAARTRVWTPDELARLKIAAVAAGKPSVALAVELAYDLGQRIGDVLRLTWSQWSGSEFALTQTKRKAKVAIPVLSNDLLGRLNSMERKGVQIVLSEVTGRPYAYGAFRSAFARIRKAADLPPDLQVRDTRRTALIEAGDGGGTDDQIRSLSGHRNRKSVESYVHPTSTMAADAQAARERARNRSGKTATKEQK